MKKLYSLIFPFLLLNICSYAQATYEINEEGYTFVPSSLTVMTGDKVVFNGSDVHPVVEVSKKTWDANGTTALEGGFAFPSGSGEVVFQEQGTHYHVCTRHVTLGMKGIIVVTQITGINDYAGIENGLSIYPNPVTGSYFTVRFNSEQSDQIYMRIIDLKGRVVYEKRNVHTVTGNNFINVDLSGISNGFYMVEITGNNFQDYFKFLKM